ncbi:MAG: VOC family protein [Pseudomonadales bacterium]
MQSFRIICSFIVLLLVASCANMNVNLPPVTDTPTDARLAGKIIWHDLITDTPEESKRFYGELFGWEFEDLGVGGSFSSVNYTLIRHNGRLIGGLVDQNLLSTDADISQWVVVMSVDDIELASKTLVEGGGTLFNPPTNLADRGTIAIAADPQGALFALLQTKTGDPLDTDNKEVGGFLWDELWTSDVEAATKFYQSLAPFEIEDREVEKDEQQKTYRLLSTGDKPRVGFLPNPIPDLAPIWATYIRVQDAAALDAIVARVEDLGGSLLLAPQDRAIGGRVALIADPSGAGIAIQTWSESRQANTGEAQ